MRKSIWVWAATGLAVATPVLGADAPPPAKRAVSVITAPDWEVKPAPEVMERHFPPIAVMFGIGGSARITCKVQADHTLSDCKVVDERPAGLGFGAAAIAASQEFRMKPETRDGEPVSGATVTVPVMFPIVDDEAEANGGLPIQLVDGLVRPVDPTAKAMALQLIAASQDKERNAATLKQTFGRVFEVSEDSGVSPAAVSEMKAALELAVDHALAQFDQDRADYLARAMSAEELKASVAYFDSGPGKAFIAAQTGRDPSTGYRQVVRSIQNEVATAFCAQRNCPKGAP